MGNRMPSSLRKREARRILQMIRDDAVTEFKPSFSFEKGISYPEAEKILGNSLMNFLEDLEKHGIARREFHDSILTCPSCGSHRVYIKLRCPSCRSTDINKGAAIEHLNCGYVDLEEKFFKAERMVCPKCDRNLKALGVDYRKPGIFFKCNICGTVRSMPERDHTCGNCGRSFPENELVIKKIFTFKVEPHAKALIDKWTVDFDELVKSLEKYGYIANYPAVVKGASGIEHNFELAIRSQETPNDIEYVIDVDIEENEIDEIKVLSFFAKAFDVKAKGKILVAIPSLSQKARDMAKNYGILVVEKLNPSDVPAEILILILLLRGRDVKELLKTRLVDTQADSR